MLDNTVVNVALRIFGALYPALVVFVIVATGNHFLLDAVASAVVACIAAALAFRLTRSRVRAATATAPSSRLLPDRA
jgi:membrane-associated phospholipid phosphatase